MTPALIWLAAMGVASASDDPWIARPGSTAVFAAVSGQQFQDFAGGTGNVNSVAHPIQSVGSKIFVRRGLGWRMDASLDVPLAATWANGASSGMFETSAGVGLVQADLRRSWLGPTSPISIGTRIAGRSGILHYGSRGRLTNLGEGSTDLGFGLGIGQVFPVRRTFLTVDAGCTYWHRFPLEAGDDSVPADDINWSTSVSGSPNGRFGVGLVSSGMYRLGGQDLGAVTVEDIDNQWAAIQAKEAKLGARLSVYSNDKRPALSAAVLRTVWARNNPVDTTLVELGVGWNFQRKP